MSLPAGQLELQHTDHAVGLCSSDSRLPAGNLTTLSSRFKRQEILEAIIYPSRVIADQYKSVLVTTTTGRAINGMRAPDDEDSLVLILSDASTLKIPKVDVEEIAASQQSNMPDGLLTPFSLKEIADLFAFLALPVAGIIQSAKDAPSGRVVT